MSGTYLHKYLFHDAEIVFVTDVCVVARSLYCKDKTVYACHVCEERYRCFLPHCTDNAVFIVNELLVHLNK